jgi:hypothetical protein
MPVFDRPVRSSSEEPQLTAGPVVQRRNARPDGPVAADQGTCENPGARGPRLVFAYLRDDDQRPASAPEQMNPKVYLETTIVSYLTAEPTSDVVQAAHQQLTREWRERRDRFVLFVSRTVLVEAAGGDTEAARRRLAALERITVLAATDEAAELATQFIRAHAMPEKAAVDALHVAIAVVNGMDYVLTWNCTHIANATIREKIERTCREAGYEPPIICTPEELME